MDPWGCEMEPLDASVSLFKLFWERRERKGMCGVITHIAHWLFAPTGPNSMASSYIEQ